MCKKRIFTIIALTLLIPSITSSSVYADHIVGGSFFVNDANTDIIITSLGSDAGFNHDLYFDNTNLFLFNSRSVGEQITLGNFPAGTELIFRLKVLDNGESYFTGSNERNVDGVIHASIRNTAPDTWEFGFEDMNGGGDKDYNDCMFRLTGKVSVLSNTSANIAIIGAWGGSTSSEPFSLVFYSNGYYVYADEIGVEHGTYIWDSSTGKFNTNVVMDSNGDHGLSFFDPKISDKLSENNTVIVNGDNITFNYNDETIITNRVASGLYTKEQINQAIQKERVKYDPDGDGIVDLKVAIHALQTISGKINKISDHLHDISIEKCVDYESSENTNDNEYEFSIELRTDNFVQYVTVNCPGGKFIEIRDYDDENSDRFWEYDCKHNKIDDLLQYGDGSYMIELHYSNGYSESTVINYFNSDQSSPLPLITSIPKFISHDDYELLSPDEPVTFTWDINSIDENAKIVAISCECGDKEYEKMYEVTDNISSQTFNLSNGIWECYFAQAILLEGKNTDNINFELITYSETDYQIIVSESTNIPEASISIDGSNEDWKNINPILSDPSGDVDLYDGIDITKVYLAKNNNSMFLRLDKAGMTLPTGEYKNNWLYFMPVEKGGKAYAIEIFLFETNVPRIRLFDISVDPYDYDQYIQLLEGLNYSVNMQTIELSWPISYFSEFSSYSLKFFTHYTINKDWKDNGDINDNTIVINP